MTKKKVFLLLALLAELALLVYLYTIYSEVEQNILNVQGQFQERYAELHREWLQVAIGMVLIGLTLPFTIYFLQREFRRTP